MNIDWLSFIKALNLKICILIFFCILCRKLWLLYGLPSFQEEFKIRLTEQEAQNKACSSRQETLSIAINESQSKQLKLEEIQRTFFSWQKKLSEALKQQKLDETNRIQTYQEKIENKQFSINQHAEQKETIEEIMCQMRKELTKIYSSELGREKLLNSISKIAAEADSKIAAEAEQETL